MGLLNVRHQRIDDAVQRGHDFIPALLLPDVLTHIPRRLNCPHSQETDRTHEKTHQVAMTLDRRVLRENRGVLAAQLGPNLLQSLGNGRGRHELIRKNLNPQRLFPKGIGMVEHHTFNECAGAIGKLVTVNIMKF